MQPTQPNQPNKPNDQDQNVPIAISGEDNIFLVNEEVKKPVDKKGVAIVTALSVVGVIFLLGILVFALIASAGGLATDYRRLAHVQVEKINKPLESIEPGLVLNRRNLEKPVETISLSHQSQPSLENVLFIGALSSRYVKTEALQKSVDDHYKIVNNYTDNLQSLLAFDDVLQGIFEQEPNLVSTIAPTDPLSIRGVSGSFDSIAENIDSQKVPKSLSKTKKKLAELYRQKSSIYLEWAQSLEDGKSTAEQAQVEINNINAQTMLLVEDQKYVDLLTPEYKAVMANQKSILSQLAN